MVGDSSHGPVKYFCIDCWDPLCEKCEQGHNKFSRAMKNHVVKMISAIDELDFELHNQQKSLFCNQHKDKAIEFYCTNCDKFSCNICYVVTHNTHKCICVEDADSKLFLQLGDFAKKFQKCIVLNEEKIKTIKLVQENLESDKLKLLEEIKFMVENVKSKLQIEHEKILGNIEDCYRNTKKVILDKADEEKREIDSILQETQTKLQSLQESLSSIKRHALPTSTVVERASLLKDKSFTWMANNLNVTIYNPNHHLLDISQWRAAMNDWLQSLSKTLSKMKVLPQIDIQDITISARYVYCFYALKINK